MSRYARRVDTTHAPIRDALKAVGLWVLDLSRLGHDTPDLLACRATRCVLVECKTPTRKDGGVKRSATSDGQRAFAQQWQGCPVVQATSPEQAVRDVLKAVGSFT